MNLILAPAVALIWCASGQGELRTEVAYNSRADKRS
jgi:hypothetical protein